MRSLGLLARLKSGVCNIIPATFRQHCHLESPRPKEDPLSTNQPDVDWDELRKDAVDALKHAYAPYSNFKVGVAGYTTDGRLVVGANVENASYGLSLCAECSMVSHLLATGGGSLASVFCVDQHGNPLMPCGRCRQLLWEHGGPDLLVMTPKGVFRMYDLLPQAFGPADLLERAADDD